MTLVTAFITKNWGFMACDNRHSYENSDGTNVTGNIQIPNGPKVTFSSPRVNIDTNTKVYKISDFCFFGGAGEFNKIIKFKDSILKENPDNILEFCRKYYAINTTESPDALCFLNNENDTFYAYSIEINKWEEANLFTMNHVTAKENRFVSLAIGSGNSIFTPVIWASRKKLNQIIENTSDIDIQKSNFKKEIEKMVKCVSEYDTYVSAETKFYDL